MTHPCPVCGQERPRRRNHTRPATCTRIECVTARKAAGGHGGKGRRKPGMVRVWAERREQGRAA